MIPIEFDEQTNKFTEPKDWKGNVPVMSLPVHEGKTIEGQNVLVSVWQPEPEDLERIKNGEPIYLQIFGKSQPVVSIYTGSPFENFQKMNPFDCTGIFSIVGSQELCEVFIELAEKMGWKHINDEKNKFVFPTGCTDNANKNMVLFEEGEFCISAGGWKRCTNYYALPTNMEMAVTNLRNYSIKLLKITDDGKESTKV